ncbi:MAG: hypothetical protein WAX04_13665 [Oscillospiraceae bacterium]
MANTINQIIEIDAVAQKRLDNASKIKEQYLQELSEESDQTNKALEEKTQSRMEKVLSTETQYAEGKKAKIKDENDATIKRLEDTYNQNHQKLEQDIFNNVISI